MLFIKKKEKNIPSHPFLLVKRTMKPSDFEDEEEEAGDLQLRASEDAFESTFMCHVFQYVSRPSSGSDCEVRNEVRNEGSNEVSNEVSDRLESAESLPLATPFNDDGSNPDEDSIIEGIIIEDEMIANDSLHLTQLIVIFLIITIAFPITVLVRVPRNPSNQSATVTSSPYDDFLRELFLTIFDEEIIDDPSSRHNWIWKQFSLSFEIKLELGHYHLDNPDTILRDYIFSVVIAGTWGEEQYNIFQENRKKTMIFPPVCELPYARCDDELNITTIVLQNEWQQGGGAIYSEIGFLTSLQHIVLTRNALVSSIPSEIGQLKDLKTLVLDGNSLSGRIPDEIGNLKKLQYFSINFNCMSESIPWDLTNLSSLIYMGLSHNTLTGPIPTSFHKLQNLQSIDIQQNRLSGKVDFLCTSMNSNISKEISYNISEYPLSFKINPGIFVDKAFQNKSGCPCCVSL